FARRRRFHYDAPMPKRALTVAVVSLVISCSPSSEPPQAPARSPGTESSGPALVLVPARGDGAEAGRLLLAAGRGPVPAAATPAERARAYLASHAAQLHLTARAIDALEVVRVVEGARGGVVTTLRPRVDGLEVVGSDTSVMTRRDGSLVAISGAVHPSAVPGVPRRFALSGEDAFARALSNELGRRVQAGEVTDRGPLAGGYRAMSAAGASLLEPCRA